MADDARKTHRLQSVELDEESLAAVSRDQEQERQIAIFDLLEANYFAPVGARRGPYDLRMGLLENRLVLDVRGPGYERMASFLEPLAADLGRAIGRGLREAAE